MWTVFRKRFTRDLKKIPPLTYTKSMKKRDESYDLLVDLLHQASQLEHSLLDAYLYTACSLKSMPQEFATIAGQDNQRRAIQYERVRAWKQSILMVTHEEMLHLHYVQCLIRALGETPFFTLPERDPDSDNWIIPNWQARIGEEPVNEGKGVEIPVAPLTPENIRHFVLFEASDALQDQDPFGKEAMDLFNRLYDFELDFRFESMLLYVEDDQQRAKLKQHLHDLYTTLTPFPPEQRLEVLAAHEIELPPVEELTFQSIGDFYNQGILPLYEQAYDFGWVTETNRKLNNEIAFPGTPAAEGFLPIGPINRDKNFEREATRNVQDPLRDFMRVEDVIKEIVEEGEGMTGFDEQAEALLAKVHELGGTRAYLQALLNDASSPDPTPPWLQSGEFLRQSHLYRFAMVMIELDQEIDLARQSGVTFDPSRSPESEAIEGHAGLKKIAEELPAQFNACYLVLIAWLARMYEIRLWEADKPRRIAIEMLASWPLMSMAIRPFLELASYFPIDLKQMFKLTPDALPKLPLHAQQLYQLYAGKKRSEEINERMDYYAVRVLADAAAWASRKYDGVAGTDALPENAHKMVLARLQALSTLNEFQKQFPFRVAGGYSNQMPGRTYQQDHPDSARFSENPAAIDPNNPSVPIFQDSLGLRLRFAGWGLVQLATDPDPTFDESGCTGTHMLHAADGNHRFDRALVWQNKPGNVILRGPREKLPPLGVNCTEVALVVADGKAQAGYVPLSVMSSTGAVQTSGVQQELQIQNLAEVVALNPQDILKDGRKLRIDLLEKDGQVPFLNGLNHLIWQDGEPVDPFILSVWADPASGDNGAERPAPLFEREIFNEGRTVLQMEPLQRLLSARAPTGFDSYSDIPAWVQDHLPEDLRKTMQAPGYPFSYLARRAGVLIEDLSNQIDETDTTQSYVDAMVSLAERLRLISVPRGTTVGWLTALLHYGHSVSGTLTVGAGDNPILAALARHTGLNLQLATDSNRHAPNARWLITYTQGLMDTDALSNLVYGELYVPLSVENATDTIRHTSQWTFPKSIQQAITAYACDFAHPFWASFEVEGNQRTTRLPDNTLITETLQSRKKAAYTYTMTGIEGLTSYKGAFTVTPADSGMAQLTWAVSFTAEDAKTVVQVLRLIHNAATQMETALVRHFMPDFHLS